MRWLVAVAIVLGLGAGIDQSLAYAAQCRDASGKFVKCPKPVHCRNDTGKYVKCGTPGARPA
jgi:hypothetical protein